MKKLTVLGGHKCYDSEVSQTKNLSPLPIMKNTTLEMIRNVRPDSVVILPTNRCNAACKECCVESNPFVKHAMNRDQLFKLINRIHEEMPYVKAVIFSGGEVTLLGRDLLDAIALLGKFDIKVRVVSNGKWASTDHSASWWANEFRSAGLCELNLSTGDEHMVKFKF